MLVFSKPTITVFYKSKKQTENKDSLHLQSVQLICLKLEFTYVRLI